MKRTAWLTLILILLLPASSLAELAQDRVDFYAARTEEWEAALGPYSLWDYEQRALFCSIYHRLPGDYINAETHTRSDLPTLPQEDVLAYAEALDMAETFLCEYDPRITESYLAQLRLASAYYDFQGDARHTITRTDHAQCWFFQFWDMAAAGNPIARCTVYLDAAIGRVCCLELGVDMADSEDWAHHTIIAFP